MSLKILKETIIGRLLQNICQIERDNKLDKGNLNI